MLQTLILCVALVLVPLDETHLHAVRGFIQLEILNQCMNKKSSLDQYYYVRAEQTDLFYAYVKNLIQRGRIQTTVTSSSLVSFHHLPALAPSGPTYILYQCISPFRWRITSYRLLSRTSTDAVLSLEVKYDIFRNGNEGV